LNLGQFKEWIELEQKGYAGSGKAVPTYRQVHGILRIFNPYNGYQPLIIADPDLSETVSKANLNMPLSEIEATANEQGKNTHIPLAFHAQLRNLLMQGIDAPIPMEPSLHVARTSFAHVLHAVRDAVLNWSLELEKDGIIGDGMTFNPEEKQIAAAKADELARQVNITIIGTMTDSSLQQGSDSANQEHRPRN
jgi:hypothetical protein